MEERFLLLGDDVSSLCVGKLSTAPSLLVDGFCDGWLSSWIGSDGGVALGKHFGDGFGVYTVLEF